MSSTVRTRNEGPQKRKIPITAYELEAFYKRQCIIQQSKANTPPFPILFDNLGEKPVQELVEWFLCPIKPKIFFEEHWEKQPFQVRRSSRDYYNGLYSSLEFSENVKKNHLNYNKEIELTAYVDGEQKTLKSDGKVLIANLWTALEDGYSIRMRNPQIYCKPLESLCSVLQEYFSNHIEANTYLTPANAEDFPPRCNDSNAFILQIEGKELWELYDPSASQILTNASDDLFEAESTEPCMIVVLNPGDLLYIPSGYIYQAQAVSGKCSLHIAISLSQLNTWGNFLKHALNIAIEEATVSDKEFRKSIPRDYLDYMGRIYSDTDSKKRQNFCRKATRLIKRTFNYVSLDSAADIQGLSFVQGSMPPILTPLEKECSVHKSSNGTFLMARQLTTETKIQFLRRNAYKLIVDTDGTYMCHSFFNAKIDAKEGPLNWIPVDTEYVMDILALSKINNFIKIVDLPHGDSEQLLEFLQSLYDNGILRTDCPLPFED